MIGMSQIKKRFFIGMGIGGGIGILGMIIISFLAISTINSYEEGTNEAYNEEFMVNVSVLNTDVIQGQTITADMLTTAAIHKSLVPANVVTNPVGQIAKYNLSADMTITEGMLTDEIISSDLRRQEINTVLLPSDMLFEGEFIDIRINFASGTDYIVLVAKEVKAINGSTIWLDLTEFEIQLLNSAIVDSYLNEGTKLYATKYVDTSMQITYEEVDEDGNSLTDVESEIKQVLYELIQSELPGLELGTEITDETTGETTSLDDYAQSGQNSTTVNSVYNFILKYNDLAQNITSTDRTYEPNAQVANAIDINPNITEYAKESIIEGMNTRSLIEQYNSQYFTQNSESMSNVVSGAEESISEQETLRNSLLGY